MYWDRISYARVSLIHFEQVSASFNAVEVINYKNGRKQACRY